jgi:hypothetical protein
MLTSPSGGFAPFLLDTLRSLILTLVHQSLHGIVAQFTLKIPLHHLVALKFIELLDNNDFNVSGMDFEGSSLITVWSLSSKPNYVLGQVDLLCKP